MLSVCCRGCTLSTHTALGHSSAHTSSTPSHTWITFCWLHPCMIRLTPESRTVGYHLCITRLILESRTVGYYRCITRLTMNHASLYLQLNHELLAALLHVLHRLRGSQSVTAVQVLYTWSASSQCSQLQHVRASHQTASPSLNITHFHRRFSFNSGKSRSQRRNWEIYDDETNIYDNSQQVLRDPVNTRESRSDEVQQLGQRCRICSTGRWGPAPTAVREHQTAVVTRPRAVDAGGWPGIGMDGWRERGREGGSKDQSQTVSQVKTQSENDRGRTLPSSWGPRSTQSHARWSGKDVQWSVRV